MTETAERPPLELAPDSPPGEIPDAVILELEISCQMANDAANDFSTAIKERAEKHKVNRAALRRYVRAKVQDKVAQLEAEAQAIVQLGGIGT